MNNIKLHIAYLVIIVVLVLILGLLLKRPEKVITETKYLTDTTFVTKIDTVEVSKIVEVKNTGHQPAWVRISVDKLIQLAEGVEGDVDLSLIEFDINDQYWIEKDGYYYYYTALAPGNTTEYLFSSVKFSESMDNMYQYSKAIIEVTAQATQVANNGDSVLEAAGWPKSE